MSEFYRKTETDLKIENVEQRIDYKLDRLGSQIERLTIVMEAGFEVMESLFQLIYKDINWLKWLVGGVLLLLLGLVSTGGLKWALHP